MLKKFAESWIENGFGGAVLQKAEPFGEDYVRDEKSHYWTEALMRKVGIFKDAIIEHAANSGYDYLFLIDSDLVIDAELIEHLKSRDKEIVAEVFWALWDGCQMELPNAWMYDGFGFSEPGIPGKEEQRIFNEFIRKFREPGLYKVGMTGACTLISKSALLKGVSFAPIYNLTIKGEDRHFCIRAAALGIDIYLDTCYPAFHIYRESDLKRLDKERPPKR
jgi:GT2 family glycosyltransferase